MKYQGGYQIIDLSGGDIYDKAKSAFETNKPVLVYDGGIASFGNVTKDSTYFVVNYIIDDKLYQATIAGDDTVTKTNVDIGGSATDIEAIEERLDGSDSGQYHIDIASYDGSTDDKVYVCPVDGYISYLATSATTNGEIVLKVNNGVRTLIGSKGIDVYDSVFVRKNTKIYIKSNEGTPARVYFLSSTDLS